MALFDKLRKPAEEQDNDGVSTLQDSPELPQDEPQADTPAQTMEPAQTPPQPMQSMQQPQINISDSDLQTLGMSRTGAQPTVTGMLNSPVKAMTEERLMEAERTLQKYHAGKRSVERRIINAQQWWKLRNWEQMEQEEGLEGSGHYKSNTAWLWNCVINKHADMMDSYPEPVILPRAADDKEESKRLNEVVPVVMEENGFEDTFSAAAWQKLQEGTAIYAITWDKDKLNGMGDIAINNISALNIFTEPGISDIQMSRNIFYCTLEDNDLLEQQYPELHGKMGSRNIALAKYFHDDHVDTSDKSVVIDWYYHVFEGNRKILHYCKFVNRTVIYATEDDPEYKDRGLYDDGEYPFVFDAMYPVQDSPYGIGMIDYCKGTQSDIDLLNQAMVRNVAMASTPRYFVRKDGSVNEKEFADWTQPIVHVDGNLAQDSVQPIVTAGLANLTTSFLQQKIDEIKFVSGNQDVNNGSTPSGVTAASAIAALQEVAGRSSKDNNRTTYRAYSRIITMVIERIRQFYDMPRQFRIIGQRGEEKFTNYSNEGLAPQPQGSMGGVDMGMRKPVFDISVRAQRENAYTKTAQNELAIQFYQLGFFNPQQVDMSLLALDMMDFRGKDDLIEKLQQMQTMQQMIMQMTQLAMAIAQANGDAAGMMQIQALATGQDPRAMMMQNPQAIAQMRGAGKEEAPDNADEAPKKQGDNRGGAPATSNTKTNNDMRERMNNTTRPDA